MRTVELSNYTIGDDCFDAIPEVLALHEVKRVMLIGGERALAAAAPGIEASLAGTDVEILVVMCTARTARARTSPRLLTALWPRLRMRYLQLAVARRSIR